MCMSMLITWRRRSARFSRPRRSREGCDACYCNCGILDQLLNTCISSIENVRYPSPCPLADPNAQIYRNRTRECVQHNDRSHGQTITAFEGSSNQGWESFTRPEVESTAVRAATRFNSAYDKRTLALSAVLDGHIISSHLVHLTGSSNYLFHTTACASTLGTKNTNTNTLVSLNMVAMQCNPTFRYATNKITAPSHQSCKSEVSSSFVSLVSPKLPKPPFDVAEIRAMHHIECSAFLAMV